MALPIVIDTREQNPLDFGSYPDVRIVRAKLWPGDYSLQAATRLMAIERKSVSDLIGTMRDGYAGFRATTPKRFDAELLGLAGVIGCGGRAFVLVEPDGDAEHQGMTAGGQIVAHSYRSAIEPFKILAFIQHIRINWRIPVILADTRKAAAEIVYQTAKAANAEKLAWRPVDKMLSDHSQASEAAPVACPCVSDGSSIVSDGKAQEGGFSRAWEGRGE